jgi:hypothetical protein
MTSCAARLVSLITLRAYHSDARNLVVWFPVLVCNLIGLMTCSRPHVRSWSDVHRVSSLRMNVRTIAAAALAGLLALSRDARAQTIRPGWHAQTHPRTGVLAAGALMFGVPYLAGVIGALANLHSSLPPEALFVPIVGPFVELAHVLPGADGSPSMGLGFDPASRVFAGIGFALDGALQYAGALLLLYGAFEPKHVIAPVPLVGSTNGLAIRVTF